jgi:hypothetical protein
MDVPACGPQVGGVVRFAQAWLAIIRQAFRFHEVMARARKSRKKPQSQTKPGRETRRPAKRYYIISI